jgi:carboxymethylenebutenolidase
MAFPRTLLLGVLLSPPLAAPAAGQNGPLPDTVTVPSGNLRLTALLWRPMGPGPFPAVLFNHGSGQGVLGASGELEHPMEWQASVLGPVFARHGYVFLYPLRRGTRLSVNQGVASSQRWDSALAAGGQAARNELQLELLETVDLTDAHAALTVLRSRSDVDPRRLAVAGHSYGASLTLLVAAHDSTLRAAVVFSGSARNWPLSPPLRQRLLAAAAASVVPTFVLFAANDYSIAPAAALDSTWTRLGKPHQVKIYPAVGHTQQEGHGFVHLCVADWERDVFAFLDPLLR